MAPRQERQERFSPEKFGEETGAEAAAQDRHGGCPRKGARAAARRQAGPARVEGPGLPSETARSTRLLSLSRQDAAIGLKGARNTPLSPPPPLPRRSAGAVRLVASPRRRRVQSVFPAPGFAGLLCRARELTPCRKTGARVRGSGPRAWLAIAPGPYLDQPEPPLASYVEAATGAAPAAACSAAAAMPSRAGERAAAG